MSKTTEFRMGYQFKDASLLKLALSHPSMSRYDSLSSYERLEFLGDRVISLVIVEYLYNHFADLSEGKMALIHSRLVSQSILAKIARAMSLGEQLNMDSGEIANGGRDNAKALEDALEALVGAIFLDGGFVEAQKFVLHHWCDYLSEGQAALITKDPKSELQEWAQSNGKAIPTYRLIERTGPDHSPLFTVEVVIDGLEPSQGQGNAKKAAEAKAAAAMLSLLY